MASILLLSMGVNTGQGSRLTNLYLCDSAGDLPQSGLEEGFVALLRDNLHGVYRVNSSCEWVWEGMGSGPIESWPLDSVFCVANEKEPADLLGFGKWELIQKEPVFMWRRTG